MDFFWKRSWRSGSITILRAIGYLHAVQRYFTEKSLHRYRFSTIAWRSMNSSLNTFRRQEQRRQSHEFSYQAAHPPPDDAFDALRARLLLHDLFLLADEEQALLIRPPSARLQSGRNRAEGRHERQAGAASAESVVPRLFCAERKQTEGVVTHEKYPYCSRNPDVSAGGR